MSFYAVSKDGKFFGGCIYPGGKMAVHDGDSARIVVVRAALREVTGRSPARRNAKAPEPRPQGGSGLRFEIASSWQLTARDQYCVGAR